MRRSPSVRILLAEQLPRRLAREFKEHEAQTVQNQGWAGLKNGELLQRATDRGFQVFLTADQNLQYQQNLAGAKLLVIVLVARTNTLEDLIPLVPDVLKALWSSKPGQVIRIQA